MKARDPLDRLLQWIVARFASRISIQISPKRFVFSSKETVEVQTCLYLEGSSGPLRVIAVGTEETSTAEVFRVLLFEDNAGVPRPIDKTECLEAFMRYGIQKAMRNPRAMLRPIVTVTGAQSLEPILHGYQIGLLLQILERSGAGRVSFE